jgi:hypothetical protein
MKTEVAITSVLAMPTAVGSMDREPAGTISPVVD